jgi:hypothetical protein
MYKVFHSNIIWMFPSLQRIGAVSNSVNRMEESVEDMRTWAISSFSFTLPGQKESPSWEKKVVLHVICCWFFYVICSRNGLQLNIMC